MLALSSSADLPPNAIRFQAAVRRRAVDDFCARVCPRPVCNEMDTCIRNLA